MLLITLGPLLFMLLAFVLAGYGPSATEVPGLLLRIFAAGILTALVHGALDGGLELHHPARRRSGSCSSCSSRPSSFAGDRGRGCAGRARSPQSPFVVAELAYRIFGETPEPGDPVTELSTWLVAGGVVGAIVAGALVCWLRYRRLEAFR